MLISIKISRNSVFSGSDKPIMIFFVLKNVKMSQLFFFFYIYEQEKVHVQ